MMQEKQKIISSAFDVQRCLKGCLQILKYLDNLIVFLVYTACHVLKLKNSQLFFQTNCYDQVI